MRILSSQIFLAGIFSDEYAQKKRYEKIFWREKNIFQIIYFFEFSARFYPNAWKTFYIAAIFLH